MKNFTDINGTVWAVTVNVGTIKRVRGLCDVNLLDIITVNEKDDTPNMDLLDRLTSDPCLLVDVLYAVCKPECDSKNITDEQFGAALSGDTINAATHALLEEIVDFFPQGKRQVFQKVLAAMRRYEETSNKKLQMILDSGDLDAAIDSELQKLNDTSTSVPVSVE